MELRLLQPGDFDLLMNLCDGIFDNPARADQTRAFLDSPLHHMVMAFDAGLPVAFASGTVILHPDKAPSLFINEVGTHHDHRRRGHGRAVTQALIDHARGWGARVWLATEPDNTAALALYRAMGGQEMAIAGFGWDGAFGVD
ncbi:MAG: GNAT family N-acetyltransferase [Paracoccaceae bacterium]